MKIFSNPHVQMSEIAQMLGKRKRREQVFAIESDERLTLDAKESSQLQALFRQHFETSFEPLDEICYASGKQEVVDAESDVTESEWEGISDEEQVKTQIIEFHGSQISKTNTSRDEFKTFMVRFPLQINRD